MADTRCVKRAPHPREIAIRLRPVLELMFKNNRDEADLAQRYAPLLSPAERSPEPIDLINNFDLLGGHSCRSVEGMFFALGGWCCDGLQTHVQLCPGNTAESLHQTLHQT